MVEARSNGEEVEHGDFQIARGEEVLVQRVIRAASHEVVGDLAGAGEDLLVGDGLIGVYRAVRWPGGEQREQMLQGARLANAMHCVDQRDVFVLKPKAAGELVVGQAAVGAAEPLDVGEGGEAHALFAFVHQRPPSLRTIAAA